LLQKQQKRNMPAVLQQYEELFLTCLKFHATVKKNTNVLQHGMGYLKKLLSPDEKKALMKIIDAYYRSIISLIVPVTLLQHYVRKYDIAYLKRQYYLHPHPEELMLRNHV